MLSHRWRAPRALVRGLSLFLLALGLLLRPANAADTKSDKLTPPPALEKAAPESLDDLKAIQEHVKKVVDKVKPCVVGLRVGNAQGSGVIINAEGYILTAGHVSGKPDRDCVVILPDGTEIKGKTLGQNTRIDSGLIKITEPGKKWPFTEMSDSAKLKKGQWCLSLGHPGGFRRGRAPVVRLGRVLKFDSTLIQSDCTLVGGDSGGPLFDMEGKVIGIHSRIGGNIDFNIHVPVNTYRETWDRLVASESWPNTGRRGNGAYLGFEIDGESKAVKIRKLTKDSPAEKAGLKEGDVILKFDGQKVNTYDDLADYLEKKKPGDEVALDIQRDGAPVTLKVKLGKRG